MKKTNLILLMIITFCIGFSQTPSLTWAKLSADMTGGTSEGKAITVDVNGNVYTCGYFNGTADFDPGVGTYTMSSGANEDIFISKLDAAGNFVWAKQMIGPGQDYGNSIKVDALGNVYTTGYFSAIVDFDPGVGTFTLATIGSNDIFVSKLDPAGNFLWAKQLGGTSGDYGNAIALDASGNVYTTGYFQGTSDFDPGSSTYTLMATNSDIFISKLDGSGNFVWAKTISGPQNEIGLGIALDTFGNVHITGNFQGTPDFDPGTGTFTLTAISADVFVSKLDAAGNFVWAKSMGGLNFESGIGIAVDAVGNVHTVGFFFSLADFDPGASSFTLSATNRDIFISKLDPAGNFIWAKQLGGTSLDYGNAIALDASNNVYTTGFFDGTADFDPGASTYTFTSALSDMFISKLDASGNFIWAGQLDGPSSGRANGIVIDALQNILTTGEFNGIVDFDPSLGIFTLSALSTNVYVHKMSQCAAVTASIASQINVLCNGSSTGAATINVSGGSGFTYSWMPSGGTASIGVNLPAGNYSCIATNSCGNASTQTLVITQPPAITLTTVASNSIICQGSSSTLSANATGGVGSITYSWVAGPSNSISAVSPTITTAYTVNVTDANNCLKTETISITVDPCTGLNEFKMQSSSEFVMYPNPAANIVTIESIQAAKFSIVNLEGKAIEQFSVEGFKMIDISQFAQGVYFIRNSTTGQTRKLIIIKE
jgi:hypothetical protein